MSDIYLYDPRRDVLYVVPRKEYPLRVYRDDLSSRTVRVSPRAALEHQHCVLVGSSEWYSDERPASDESYLTRGWSAYHG